MTTLLDILAPSEGEPTAYSPEVLGNEGLEAIVAPTDPIPAPTALGARITLKVPQVAALAGVAPSTVRGAIRRGRLAATTRTTTTGKQVHLIPVEEAQRFAEEVRTTRREAEARSAGPTREEFDALNLRLQGLQDQIDYLATQVFANRGGAR